MSDILSTPKAKRFARENKLSLSRITASGIDGKIRFVTYADTLGALSSSNRERTAPRATHLAEKIAAINNIDLHSIKPTGEIIRKDDVLARLAERSPIKKTDSRRELMLSALRKGREETLSYTVYAKLDTSAAFNFAHSGAFADGSFFDLLLYAVARALKHCPKINSVRENGVYQKRSKIDLSVAMKTDWGIITPVLRDALSLNLAEMCSLRRELREKSRAGRLTNDDISGGSFTVSNLGIGDVTYFMPILNYPQAAILGIGKTEDELYLKNDGTVASRKQTYFSLTCDHEIIDGMDAADFFHALSVEFSCDWENELLE